MNLADTDALRKLKEGNSHFVGGYRLNSILPHQRAELIKGQSPFATILSCSDSRVPPEHIFDQGLGSIFVVRTAGNVVDKISLGSLEYGVGHLKTPLLVILGHTYCGAVTATVKGQSFSPHLDSIVNAIRPAVDVAKKLYPDLTGSQFIDMAVRENVIHVAKTIRHSSKIISQEIGKNTLQLVGAIYNMASAEVNFFEIEK